MKGFKKVEIGIDDAGELVVDVEGKYESLLNSFSDPWINRIPIGDVTVPDGGCIITVDYYTPSGTLTLLGDAVLEILI